MNDIINKFLLTGDKFMSELHLPIYLHLPTVLMGHLIKSKKEYKSLKKLETQNVYTEIN